MAQQQQDLNAPLALGPSPLAAGDRQISVVDARAAITAALRPIDLEPESTPLTAACGRVLAADLVSPIDVPAHDNSAMDGYAFDGTALHDGVATALRSVGNVFAGKPFEGRVGAGEAVRIMTGAVMPAGLDTVVPLELCRVADEQVSIEAGVIRRGENRRHRGEDLKRGQPALRAGQVLRPADLGLAASLGFEGVAVKRRLRVALFSTGDELREPGQPLDAGCIYDSNRTTLAAAVQRLGMEVVDLGLVRDDREALRAVLVQALQQADVVITSGGVSAGDADHTRELLSSLGTVAFWKVAMRPGRPFAFGPLSAGGDTSSWLFALPGNPVAALVTFYAFARDALLQLAGAQAEALPVLRARSVAAIRKRPGRTEFQRGRVSRAVDGQWEVRITGSQGAGILRSMSEANALVVLQHDQASVAAGEAVEVWLFDGLV
jgi:molybdopterin molybdotransferase